MASISISTSSFIAATSMPIISSQDDLTTDGMVEQTTSSLAISLIKDMHTPPGGPVIPPLTPDRLSLTPPAFQATRKCNPWESGWFLLLITILAIAVIVSGFVFL